MATPRLAQCLAVTLKFEGDFSDNPADPGGATDFGVTQRTYDGYRSGLGLPQQPVQYISQDEVQAIYRLNYWNGIHGDALPIPVDLAVFDFAVNSGVSKAVQYLQLVLGFSGADVDGAIGPVTLQAVMTQHPVDLAEAYNLKRKARFQQIVDANPNEAIFLKGWNSRVDQLRAICNATDVMADVPTLSINLTQ